MSQGPYFMAQVDLIQSIEALQKSKDELDRKLELQAIQHMRYAMHQISNAMEEVFRKVLK